MIYDPQMSLFPHPNARGPRPRAQRPALKAHQKPPESCPREQIVAARKLAAWHEPATPTVPKRSLEERMADPTVATFYEELKVFKARNPKAPNETPVRRETLLGMLTRRVV